MGLDVREIPLLLRRRFGDGGWRIRSLGGGRSKDSFLAERSGRRVFVKLEVDAEPLGRLAELGVAPPVVDAGILRGTRYVIQEYIDGRHPDRAWFGDHLSDLAAFVHRYHDDAVLAERLGSRRRRGDCIAHELAKIRVAMAAAREHGFSMTGVTRDYEQLLAIAGDLQRVPLVPVHADPNRKNFLLASAGLFIVDWDDITLSDPLRDTGLILWWYVPRWRWPEFFAAYRLTLDEEMTVRLYWWAARTSLLVALWLVDRDSCDEARDFLEDFTAAVHRRENPHGTAP